MCLLILPVRMLVRGNVATCMPSTCLMYITAEVKAHLTPLCRWAACHGTQRLTHEGNWLYMGKQNNFFSMQIKANSVSSLINMLTLRNDCLAQRKQGEFWKHVELGSIGSSINLL